MSKAEFKSKHLTLSALLLTIVSCGKPAAPMTRVASTDAANLLTSSKWSHCVSVLGVGSDILYEKREVEFTSDGHMIFEPVSLSTDSTCKDAVTLDKAKATFGDRAKLSAKFILGYRVGATADARGHYDFDVIYGPDGFGTNEYTKMAIEGDILRISKVCNFEDAEIGRCEETNGRSPEQRADRLDEHQDLFSFTRR